MGRLDYTLYLVTDRRLLTVPTLEEAVEQAIEGGCTMVQLREKECSSREFFETALRIRTVTKKYGVPLLINDRADIAMAADADGVHIGQQDLPCRVVRGLLGPDKLIGVSAATVEEARKAERDGASYLGVGAMNVTSTKTNTRPVTPELLREIKASVKIPVVAIGGIQCGNVGNLAGTGIDGIAVVSAVLAQPDIRMAASTLREAFRRTCHAGAG